MSKSKRRRRWQLSLRMLLILVTLVGIGFAYDLRYRRQHLAADQLKENNAKVTYHTALLSWLPWIGDKLRDVESVDMSHSGVDSETFKLLLRFPRLERLYLARTGIEDEDLPVIAQLRNLNRLALWHTRITNEGIHHLIKLKRLEALDVHGTRLSEDSLETFVQMPQLRTLKFDFNEFSDRGLALLAKMNVRNLGEVRCREVTDAGLQSLQLIDPTEYSITRLEACDITDDSLLALVANGRKLPVGPDLHIRHCAVSDRILPALPWDRLEDVRFVKTDVTYDAVVEMISDKAKAILFGTRGIRIAEWYGWYPGGGGMGHSGTGVWLELDPAELTKVQLSKLPNLTSVFVDRKQPAGDLLLHLRDHTKVREFEMNSVPAETPVIEHISTWKHLRKAKLNCCNPRTSFDMSPLAKLPELRVLEFSCTPFGDEAFETFGQLQQLRELKMTSADKVTGSGLKHLRTLKQLNRFEIHSRANWDDHFDDLMSLDHIIYIRLINIQLNDANRQKFDAMKGRDHITWR